MLPPRPHSGAKVIENAHLFALFNAAAFVAGAAVVTTSRFEEQTGFRPLQRRAVR
jgi:hypothetical protein